jgi:uncharacterized membrane protein
MNEEKLELRNLFHAVNVVLSAFLVGMVCYYIPRLPAKIPMHFAADGTPNGWSDKSGLIGLLAVALGITGIFYIIMFSLRSLSKRPSILNIPRKELFLALPPEKKEIYWNLMKEHLAAMAAAMNILWVTAIWGTIKVALGEIKKLPAWSIWLGLILILIVNLIYLPRLIKLPKKLTD